MEDYVVSALKYRPSSFETVVGQESITKTLENAITNEELAKAYLFCGPRGVGKTTCARIFAKAINEGVSGIDADFSYNLFELDAASNNSVDDIRQIIDQVRVPPQIGKYKVYIIDEVHMLSKAAFNAFLKTLEEPPAHAIFVLATTEKHKVLPTILSRCQIYDFKRISVGDMVKHLENVAQQEGISYENEALHLIAQKADGALRDALSIFDQMVSFTGKNLSREAVADSLNVLDYDYFFRAAENFTHGDVTSSLLLFDEVIDNGFDPLHYLNGLNEHFRNLLVVKDAHTVKLLDQTDKIRDQYLAQSEEFSMAQLLEYLEEGQKTAMNYRTSNYKRLLVEVLLMKYCNYSSSLSDEKKKSKNRRYSVGLQSETKDSISRPPDYPKIIIQVPSEEEQANKLAKISEGSANSTTEISKDTPVEKKEIIKPQYTVEDPVDQNQKVAPIESYSGNNENATAPVAESPNTESSSEISSSARYNSDITTESPSETLDVVRERKTTESQVEGEPSKAHQGPIDISKKKKLSRTSISLTEMHEEPEEIPFEESLQKKDSFSQSELETHWKKYAEVVKGRGQIGFASSLVNNIPTIVEGNVLEIVLENQVQVENINEERGNLHEYLRANLKNDLLTIKTVINEDEAPVEQLGPEDQLRAMMTKNENLKSLFEDLDLDLER